MFMLEKSKRRISSRKQIDIEGVRDGVLCLPRTRYRKVLSVSSLNFELKSEEEQDAIIDTYESFLNSVGYSLQVLIRTREIDIDKYLDSLDEQLHSEMEDIYREQLKNYKEFIRTLIATNKILTRLFYVIVPYEPQTKIEFDAVIEQLALRVDIVMKGLARLGMHSRELSSLEVLELFYSFYSPEQSKRQPLTEKAFGALQSLYTPREVAE